MPTTLPAAASRKRLRLTPRLRRVCFQLHRWTGLASGVLLTVISLTGVALLFRFELDHTFGGRLGRVKTRGPRLTYDELGRALGEQRLPGHVDAMQLPMRQDQPVVFELSEGNQFREAWMDPYTGELLAYGPQTRSLSGWIDELHYRLLTGDAGEVVAGLAGAVLVVAALTGLLLEASLLLALVRRPRRGRRLRDRHGSLGVWAFGACLLFGSTGAWMCRFGLQRLVSPVSGPPPVAQGVAVDRFLRTAATFRDFRPDVIVYPEREGEPVEIRGALPLSPSNWLYGSSAYVLKLDSRSGELRSTFDPSRAPLWQTVEQWSFALHAGSFARQVPLWVKLLYAVLGSAPALLALSGYWLYFRRPAAAANR